MGFYIRKSVSAGPFRFNLSKSGVGLSVGVKGLRIGTGPRGHYIRAGTGGFYYRASINPDVSRRRSQHTVSQKYSPTNPQIDTTSGVQMVEIDSGDVAEMRDERFRDLIDEINVKSARLKLSVALGGIGVFAGLVTFSTTMPQLAPIVFGCAVGLYFLGMWFDSFKRTTVMFYNFEDGVAGKYEALIAAFESLSGCQRAWHVPAGGAVRDLTTWKRNAGAAHLLKRTAISLKLGLPEVIKCNIDVPRIPVGSQNLYFFPDFLMVQSKARVGAVGYESLTIRTQLSNFIEDDGVPSDAEVLYKTWLHPNKNGGPDRRFANNRQIPVCRYESIHFASASGVNELMQVSCPGHGDKFALAVAELGKIPHPQPAGLIGEDS